MFSLACFVYCSRCFCVSLLARCCGKMGTVRVFCVMWLLKSKLLMEARAQSFDFFRAVNSVTLGFRCVGKRRGASCWCPVLDRCVGGKCLPPIFLPGGRGGGAVEPSGEHVFLVCSRHDGMIGGSSFWSLLIGRSVGFYQQIRSGQRTATPHSCAWGWGWWVFG